jgi:anti-sigma regulatory factor (Ser/Thr protein kinase)
LREWLAGDGEADLEDVVLLVASELVTNAVFHARTGLRLSYAADKSSVEIGVLLRRGRPRQRSCAPTAA